MRNPSLTLSCPSETDGARRKKQSCAAVHPMIAAMRFTLRLRDGVNNERIALPRHIGCGFRRLLLSGSSGFRVAHRGGSEAAEREWNEDMILNKPSAKSASLWCILVHSKAGRTFLKKA